MSSFGNCCEVCPPTVSVPGPEGTPGTNGTNGLNGGNAYTVTSSNIAYVTPGTTVGSVSFATTAFMAFGQYLFISDGANVGIFQVTSITSSTTAILTYIVDPINTATVGSINAPAAVTPSGFNGTNGTPGNGGFTTTRESSPPATGSFTTPAIGSSTSIPVLDSSWMQVGTFVAVSASDGTLNGIYYVSGVTGGATPAFTGFYYAFTVNTNATVPVVAGGIVALSFPGIVAPVTLYGTGTAYAVTDTNGVITFGTSGAMTITLPQSGTWLLQARVRYDYVSATVSTTITLTTKLVSSSAGSLTPSTGYVLPGGSSLSNTVTVMDTAPIIYTTTNFTDTISLDAVTAATTVTTLNAVEASIVATFLHP